MPCLPAIVQAQLRIAYRKPLHQRGEAIEKVLKEAMLYYPKYFLESQNNEPLYRELSSFEKYIETLKTRKPTNKEITK